jgi:conjugal transfer pilus assembly protein TraW
LKKSLLLLCAGLFVATAHAKDLGTQGTVWPITEIDIRQLMMESAARADWSAAEDEVKSSAQQYLATLPKRDYTSPPKTRTDWMDPSVVITSDIQAPIKQADGSYAWQVLAAKGTKANPLVSYRPVTAMLLFDGANEQQLAAVKKVMAIENERIVPTEAGRGDLKKVNEALGRPVFYASDAMLQRFQIKYLPALIYPGYGAQELMLGVTSFAAPYPYEDILTAWPDLNYKVAPRPKVTRK